MHSRTTRFSFNPYHPGWLLTLQTAALWPIGLWYVRRMGDGSDEPWGLLALATVLLLAYAERDNLREEPRPLLLIAAGGLTVLCACLTPWIPALPRAAIGLTALGLCFAALHNRSRPLLPLMALLLLSLPLIASLQFYLGFPLRAFTAWSSAGLLSLAGLSVEPTGTTLTWLGSTVLVDAPCSGVHMLWVGLFLTALLSYLMRTPAAVFLLNGAVALMILLVGNVLRNTLLFVKESGMLPLPDWTHEALGVVTFLFTSLAIATFICGRRRAAH